MQFCDFELEERQPLTSSTQQPSNISSETTLQCLHKSTEKQFNQQQVSFQLVLYPELQSRPWIQLLGEVMLDMNVFQSGNERCMRNSDYPWNSFRPTLKIEEFNDGSMQSYHENAVKGRLDFQDIITLLMQQPLSSARIVGEKLAKYQSKIIQAQDIRKILLSHYSEEDLKVIFAEIQAASIQKAMGILSTKETRQSQQEKNNQSPELIQKSKIFYLYTINTINENSLLPTPVIVGQNSSLVELMGGGQPAYKHQMVRKGYLNFDSYYSHLQMLLLELGVHKECWLQARTIEGFSVPIHITVSHTLLHKLQLAPLDAVSFNSTLTIYNVDVPQNILTAIEIHRQKHKFEGFQDDLSYMLHCQIFLQKHYNQSYDLSSDRRCTYKSKEPQLISEKEFDLGKNI